MVISEYFINENKVELVRQSEINRRFFLCTETKYVKHNNNIIA